ncbi:MAG: hypothetical protein IKO56_07960 [Alphaproteobacteria bacterium]|nr:hypothetical protein [Alphaproteobacteria bacterium]MBR6363542.1 hypothetical protein [Alphaproteobacteria bacterium]
MKKLLFLSLISLLICGCEYSQEKQKIYDEVYVQCVNDFYNLKEFCDCDARFYAEHFKDYASYKKWKIKDSNRWGDPVNKAHYDKCTPIFEKEMQKSNPDFNFEEEAKKALKQITQR